MIRISQAQLTHFRRESRAKQLLSHLQGNLADFGTFTSDEQAAFVLACIDRADELGLHSDSGTASYALGAWWLNLDFEQQSPALQRLLGTTFPLARKVCAMNDWVHARLRWPTEPHRAEKAMNHALERTEAWGQS
jgi:hypothetical protein